MHRPWAYNTYSTVYSMASCVFFALLCLIIIIIVIILIYNNEEKCIITYKMGQSKINNAKNTQLAII